MICMPKELLARDLTGAELAIYAVLTSCGKKWVRIPYRTLAKRAGISASTAIASVLSLTEKGLLSRWLCTLNNRKQTNRYKVLLRAGMTDFFCLPARLIGTIAPNALLLFAYLSAHTNHFGDCRMSERRLAKETGLSRGTVRKHSSFLASCGALLRQARFYAKKRLTNARRCFSFSLFSRSADRGWYNFYITKSEQTRGFPKQKGVEKSLFGRLYQIGENARRNVKETIFRLANRMRGRSGSRSADDRDATGQTRPTVRHHFVLFAFEKRSANKT